MAYYIIVSLWVILAVVSLYQMYNWEKYLGGRDKTDS
jgi:hypothetical protein